MGETIYTICSCPEPELWIGYKDNLQVDYDKEHKAYETTRGCAVWKLQDILQSEGYVSDVMTGDFKNFLDKIINLSQTRPAIIDQFLACRAVIEEAEKKMRDMEYAMVMGAVGAMGGH